MNTWHLFIFLPLSLSVTHSVTLSHTPTHPHTHTVSRFSLLLYLFLFLFFNVLLISAFQILLSTYVKSLSLFYHKLCFPVIFELFSIYIILSKMFSVIHFFFLLSFYKLLFPSHIFELLSVDVIENA